MIKISDPIFYLDDEIKLGWHFGSDEFNLQKNLHKILNEIAKKLNIKRFFFFGGSGGSCASLFYSSFFENSIAIFFNPQTNIEKYPAGNYSIIKKFASIIYNTTKEKPHEKITIDIRSAY